MLIDSAKVVINIASAARVTTCIDLPSSPLLGKAEDVARDMLKVVSVSVPPPVAFPDDTIEATVSRLAASRPGPATGSQMMEYSEVNAAELNPLSSPLGSTALNDPGVGR